MKRLFREAGLPIIEFTHFARTQWEATPHTIEMNVIEQLGFPCFVKPANLGSSVGISKAVDEASLHTAIALAARFDRKIIIERGVDAREIEVSVQSRRLSPRDGADWRGDVDPTLRECAES